MPAKQPQAQRFPRRRWAGSGDREARFRRL